MYTLTDHTFQLEDGDRPTFTQHGDSFSIHLPSYGADGVGFSLRIPYPLLAWFEGQVALACERSERYRQEIHGDPSCEPATTDDPAGPSDPPSGTDDPAGG